MLRQHALSGSRIILRGLSNSYTTSRIPVALELRPRVVARAGKALPTLQQLHTRPQTQEAVTDGTASQPPTAPSVPESPKKSWSRPTSRSLIYAAAFFFVGFSLGKVVSAIVIPPPLPLPDSPEDEFFLSKLREDVNDLPLVKELRTQREEWLEYEAYMNQPQEIKAKSLPAGIMQGSRGLGVQRIFWNKKERRLITIIYFGGALAGWPGVTHGGAIATVIQESLEIAANGPPFDQTSSGQFRLANMELRYRKPTTANALFAVRAEVDESSLDKSYEEDARVNVKATLENALTGVVCVEVNGHCDNNSGESVRNHANKGTTSPWSIVKGIFG